MIEFHTSTFIIQVLSFFALVAALREILFVPAMRVLEEREKRTTGMHELAAELAEESESLAANHASRVAEVRKAIAAESEAARGEVSKEERSIVAAAQDEASSYLSQQRETLRADADAARTALAKDAEVVAAQIAERVLGREAA